MRNTSLGYHTFSIFRKLSYEEYRALCQDFAQYVKSGNGFKGYPDDNVPGTVWEYTHNKNKGIRWRLSSKKELNGYISRKIVAIINPKTLLYNNYITASTESDLRLTEQKFDEEADNISPYLLTFKDYSLNRADYSLNIDLKELGYPCTPKQMMKLIKQGDIPENFKEHMEYSKTGHRPVPYKYSLYLENSSVTINFYWKYPQQTETHPNFDNRDKSENVIRLEVQCKSKKLHDMIRSGNCDIPMSVRQNIIESESIPVRPMLSDRISEQVVREYFYKIIRKGHYFTYSGALAIIRSYGFKRKKEERLLYAIELVKECDGISKAKASLICNKSEDEAYMALREFNKALRELDELLINPVTIPRRWAADWGVKWLPNLMWTYDCSIGRNIILFQRESRAMQHINKYLSL